MSNHGDFENHHDFFESISYMKSFFIAGVQRSGTTLLSVLLDNHSAVDLDGFSKAFRLITCFKNYEKVLPLNLQHSETEILKWKIKTDYKGRLAEFLDYENLEKYADYKDLIRASIEQRLAKNGKVIWGDKSPNLQHYLADLLLLIPEAKIIHIVRDGRATAYSNATRNHQHILLAAQDWVKGNVVAISNQQLVGEAQYMIIKYENLLEFPEKTMKKVCTFLAIDFEEKMLNLQNEKEGKSYVKNTFDTSKINQYKKQISTKNLRKIERIQAPLLQKMGYELMFPTVLQEVRLLSLKKQIFLRQIDNVKMLSRSKRMGMIDRQIVEVPISWRNRFSKFLINFGKDFFPKAMYQKLWEKGNNQERFFRK